MDCNHDSDTSVHPNVKQKCTKTRRQEHTNAANLISEVPLSFTGAHVMTMTEGKQPALMNEAR